MKAERVSWTFCVQLEHTRSSYTFAKTGDFNRVVQCGTTNGWQPVQHSPRTFLFSKTCQNISVQVLQSRTPGEVPLERTVLQSLDKQLWMSRRGGRETDTSLTGFTLSFVGKKPYMIIRPDILLLTSPFSFCPGGTLPSSRESQLQKVPISIYDTFIVNPVFTYFPLDT